VAVRQSRSTAIQVTRHEEPRSIDPGSAHGAESLTGHQRIRAEAAPEATGARGGAAAPAIALRDLGRAYGERVALSGVTLELPAGRTLAVFGANGAGKTTLLRILATLLRPHRGEARVLGHALPREGWAVRGRIGLLGHEPLLYRDLSARENLRFHARLHGAPAERIEALLDAVAMTRRADEPVHTLSRGMVQRVAVCRAVLHEPELLLLDEPLANLDPGAAAAVEGMIGPGGGMTRVVISHDVAHGLAEADVVLGLRGGRQALAAPRAAVDEAAVRELYG
jgi:heme exporter protein A